MSLFTAEDCERVRARVLELASSDERVVAGAVVGSLAHGDGDRWSGLGAQPRVKVAPRLRTLALKWDSR